VSVPEDLLELAAGYALGSLDEADRARVEALLASGKHPELNAAVAEFSEASALLATGAPSARPSPALKSRVMSAIVAESRPAPAAHTTAEVPPATERGRIVELKPRRTPMWVHAAWGTAVAASLVFGLVTWNETVRLGRELTAQRGQVSELQSKLTEEQRWSDVVTAPGTREAALQVTPDGQAEMSGRAIYDPKTRSAVIVFENVRVPSDKDLELWALKSDGVQSLGLLAADESGRVTLRIPDAGDPAAVAGFAVTIEKTGGSGNPTAPGGPIVLAGKFAPLQANNP